MDFQQALQAVSGDFPQLFGRVPYVPPTLQQEASAEPVVEKKEAKEEKKPEKRSAPKKVPQINVGFSGPAVNTPVFHRAAGFFGLAAEDLAPVDRNQLQGIIELTAEKLGTIDERKILNFIRQQSHSFSGENKFREMYQILLLGQKPTVRKSPWGR